MPTKAMRLQPLLSLPVLLPTLHVQACRSNPLLTHLDALRPQSFPPHALSNFAPSSGRSLTTSYRRQQPAMAGGGGARFSYRVAASFSAKGRKFESKLDVFTFNPAAESESELEEVFTGRPAAGQDAFFVAPVGSVGSSSAPTGGEVAFGVADGVGGWADSGIDSADFSHGLCRTMALVAREERKIGPRELLWKAYERVTKEGEVEGGGSTACVGVGGRDGVVRVANLGDSGFLQLRPSAVHYSSNPQTHAFNTPFQLSIVPPKVLQMSQAFGGGPLSDMPSEADVTTHEVNHGDVLVFATDGVWDNLPAEEVLGLVSKQMMARRAWVDVEGRSEVGKGLVSMSAVDAMPVEEYKGKERNLQTEIAVSIASQAKAASNNQKRDGPFAREVQKHYPAENWHGGKVDDICVLVAVVLNEGKRRRDPVGEPKL